MAKSIYRLESAVIAFIKSHIKEKEGLQFSTDIRLLFGGISERALLTMLKDDTHLSLLSVPFLDMVENYFYKNGFTLSIEIDEQGNEKVAAVVKSERPVYAFNSCCLWSCTLVQEDEESTKVLPSKSE